MAVVALMVEIPDAIPEPGFPPLQISTWATGPTPDEAVAAWQSAHGSSIGRVVARQTLADPEHQKRSHAHDQLSA